MASRKHRVLPYGIDIISGSLGSELSKLFRRILKDNGIDAGRYNDLMYWHIVREQAKANRNEKAEARMGLSQELMKEVMSWKTFIKGLKFLHIDQFRLEFLLTVGEGRGEVLEVSLKSKLSAYAHPGEILAALLHSLSQARGITPELHEGLLTAYVEKTRGNQSKKDKAAARASLNKELQKDAMSWRTFVKGLVYHGVLRYTMQLTLYRRLKEPTTHFVSVNLDDYIETTEDGDE